MNGWIKLFADGTDEIGSDEYISKKLASWSKGRLEDMTGVELHHNGTVVILEGTGSFWQSDDLIARMSQNGRSQLITRRIQKQIQDDDMWLLTDHCPNFYRYSVASYRNIQHPFSGKMRILAQRGKWLTLELDVVTNNVIFSFQDRRI